MIQLLKTSKVWVCVGSGGVGKTSVAASLGFMAAKQGLRVHVLTVDPSQRLKQTLGIKEGQQTARIEYSELKGELYASIIDPKKTFDEFLARASGSQQAEKLIKNRLYQQLSTSLSGSQEFTALERVYLLQEQGNLDLIILDTPPTKHAIDFLHAPQKLAAVLNEGITKWFRDPDGKKQGIFKTILATGTKTVLKALESITGSEFMSELADFFNSIEKFQGKIQERVTAVHRLLVHPQTHFLLVTSFDEAKLKEAEYFAKEIRQGGYQLSAMLINRAFPYWYNQEVQGASPGVAKLFEQMKYYYQNRDQMFVNFTVRMSDQGEVLRLPELKQEISDIGGVAVMATHLEDGGQKV